MDGIMPGKRVVILGSGDIGLIMARRLTFQGAKVLACIEIMKKSSGLMRNVVQCLNDYDIPLYLSHTVTDIQGKDRLTGVTVAKVDEHLKPIPGTEIEYECDTLLLSVGLIPENEIARAAGVELSPGTKGAVVTDTFETNIPGVFACGNSLHVHDLVDNVSAESEIAGRFAAEYVKGATSASAFALVADGIGVMGTVPQKISLPQQAPVKLMFRPRRTFKNAVITVEADGTEILRRRRPIAVPGEMAELTLPAGAVPEGTATVTVSIGGDIA
jgi:NADPH-dependent 2,4-dienoyl-CoA reductase/sulfur reductase-like enzyme